MVVSPLYGVVAPELGWVPSPRFLLRRARILRLLSGRSLGRIVEIGCGSGALLHELAALSVEAVGVETSEHARTLAESITRQGRGRQRILAEHDPDWGGDWDLVCAFDVLEHIEHDDAALEQWSRWLRQGGKICVSVPAHQSRWGAGDEWAGHWRRYDRKTLLAMLSAHRFTVEHLECYGFPLGNLTERYGERFYRRALEVRDRSISKAEASAGSGVDRAYYVRKFRFLDSWVGRRAFQLANFAQHLASRTDWGTGYLVLARKA
jgi:SAM-dependent methyltransferase